MTKAIQKFIESKDIAVLGASARKKKFGNFILKELTKRGYNIYPVHLTADRIDNMKAHRTIFDLPDNIDTACVCMKPENAAGIIDDLIKSRIQKIWFQQGADFSKYVKRLEEADKLVVHKKCVLMYAPPVSGIHALHRFLAKIFGRL